MSAVLTPLMPAPAAEPQVTPEDLLRMEDGRAFELVDGRLVERNMSTESSYVGGEVLFALKAHTRAAGLGYVLPADASFRCFPAHPGRVRKPDVSYIAADRLPADQYRAEGHCTVAPDLVVEVVSPNDTAGPLNAKVAEWLRAGVRLVWVIDPESRTVLGYHRDRRRSADVYEEADTLTGDPVLPGFAVPVADLFKLPTVPGG